MVCIPSEVSDRSVLQRSLIRVIANRMKYFGDWAPQDYEPAG